VSTARGRGWAWRSIDSRSCGGRRWEKEQEEEEVVVVVVVVVVAVVLRMGIGRVAEVVLPSRPQQQQSHTQGQQQHPRGRGGWRCRWG
jgi:hypothetical protein